MESNKSGLIDAEDKAAIGSVSVIFLSFLRRGNTRYKNRQFVVQHCFVASFGRCFPFFTLHDQLVGLKEVVAKSRAWVNFEQQILALLLVFHQTHNLSCNKCAPAPANQPISMHCPKLATKQCCATS